MDQTYTAAGATSSQIPNGTDRSSFHDLHEPRPDMDKPDRIPNRLVLCFDGTGNSFQGNTSDTNILKLYDLFDRNHPHQMHYYQPGIGTYPTQGSVNTSSFGSIKRSVEETLDQMFATSFDAHVIAGYRFLMRYYQSGDRIYIFGFSRGAFTARFLSRMVSHVGFLTMGNEEMVPFAYKVYQDYELGHANAEEYMRLFKNTFCKDERQYARGEISKNESGIKTHFLGLFDCVNSVGTLDLPWGSKRPLPKVHGTAEHIRHAVAIDERRVKFKPALFVRDEDSTDESDIKEVWFPGNHGDVGGGWKAELVQDPKLTKERDLVQRARKAAKSRAGTVYEDKTDDLFQLSDIPLKWMIDEIDHLPADRLAWNEASKKDFLDRFAEHKESMMQARMHDTMVFGGGSSSWYMPVMWKVMEGLPFIKRWDLKRVGGKAAAESALKVRWDYVALPLHFGRRREIPPNAHFHHSILRRMRLFPTYRPHNPVWLDNGAIKMPLSALDLSHDGATRGRTKQQLYLVHDTAATVGSIDTSTLPTSTLASPDDAPEKEDRLYLIRQGDK